MSTSLLARSVQKSLSKAGAGASSRLLVGVSGGVDSMVLLSLLHALGWHCTASHVNFTLRGQESDDDETFVRDYCLNLGVDYITQRADTRSFADEKNLNIQSAARAIRYQWWKELLDEHRFDFVATAHHRDDNIETFFINLLRGSGLKGLKGIPFRRDYFIRPLLDVSRKEIESFANEYQIPFRTDSSNAKDDYLRNRIRHHVLPVVKTIAPDPDAFMKHSLLRLNVEWEALENAYEQWKEDNISILHESFQIQVNEKENAFVLKWLEEKGLPWQLAYDYVLGDGGQTNNPLVYGDMILSKTKNGFYFKENTIFQPVTIAQPGRYPFDHGELLIELVLTSEFEISDDPFTEFVDQDAINWPAEIRAWSPGDKFKPIGMKGQSKKLQDFLTDLKLESHQKSQVRILSSGGQIVWVIGKRLDENFKVKNKDSPMYKLTYIPSSTGW